MTTRNIDQLPTYTGDPSSTYTLVRAGGVTYKLPVSAITSTSTDIGGYPVSLSAIQTGDLLTFGAAEWVNEQRTLLTDGGNF